MGFFGKSKAEKEAEARLLAAAESGDVSAVRAALDAGASVDCMTGSWDSSVRCLWA